MTAVVDLHNPTKAPRIIYDGIEGSQRAISIKPGKTVFGVALADHVVMMLRSRTNDLVVTMINSGEVNGHTVDLGSRPPLVIDGMYGIGDNLHQRAALRELIKKWDIWLYSCHVNLYHDLIEHYGLKVLYKPTRLRAQARTLQRERQLFYSGVPPKNAPRWKIWYHKSGIDRFGSILEAMNNAFFTPLARPDFSLPIREEWKASAQKLMSEWKPDKPLLIYRPIVLRREWDSKRRNPDSAVYWELYHLIKDQFFTVSVADLEPNQEWIVGPEAPADVKLHRGELDFPTMAALWQKAALVFANAGFGPVLAQAVGTPSIVVYGGRESFRTTERAGAHLAPTLGIDPDRPCDCHSHTHHCDPRITLPPALERVQKFVKEVMPNDTGQKSSGWSSSHDSARPQPCEVGATSSVLVFGTFYVDSMDRVKLTNHWINLHRKLNPNCDLLLVDSVSPLIKEVDLKSFETSQLGKRAALGYFSFPDNIGHLSRAKVTQGKDGWGRAFCYGLDHALAAGYEYAVHIEGDSLFRLPVLPIIEQMKKDQASVLSIPVTGMRIPGSEIGWVETGLMFFSTRYLGQSKFTKTYNWPGRRVTPTPEVIVRRIIGNDLRMMPWKGMRGDKNQITHHNVVSLKLDWITHCHEDTWAYDRFVEDVLNK